MSNFHRIPFPIRRKNPVRLVQDFGGLSIAFARYDLLGLFCLSAHNVTTLQDSLNVTDCGLALIWPNGFTRPTKELVTPLWSQELLLETGVSYPIPWHLSEQDFHL